MGSWGRGWKIEVEGSKWEVGVEDSKWEVEVEDSKWEVMVREWVVGWHRQNRVVKIVDTVLLSCTSYKKEVSSYGDLPMSWNALLKGLYPILLWYSLMQWHFRISTKRLHVLHIIIVALSVYTQTGRERERERNIYHTKGCNTQMCCG